MSHRQHLLAQIERALNHALLAHSLMFAKELQTSSHSALIETSHHMARRGHKPGDQGARDGLGEGVPAERAGQAGV